MTTYYVGTGGSDTDTGTSWAARKATLTAAEDIPVAAGDLVYVGPGTYRETLTCDVSGNSTDGIITFFGDYSGDNTDDTGGVVRITGSDNDQSATRNSCIIISGKSYRTFTGFTMDTFAYQGISFNADNSDNIIIEKCYIVADDGDECIGTNGDRAITNITVRKCYLFAEWGFHLNEASSQDNANILIENCIFKSLSRLGYGVDVEFYPATIKNCLFDACYISVRQRAALTTGQVVNVNNCIITGAYQALVGQTTTDLVEDYNTFYCNTDDRVDVDVGANSVTYPPLFDTRWFHEMVNSGTMLTPFDLASYSQVIGLTPTSPSTDDMRGTAPEASTDREWGPLEYDADLDIAAGSGTTYIRGLLGCG